MSAEITAADNFESPDWRWAAWMATAQAGNRQAYEKVLADSAALIRAAARRKGVTHDHLDDVCRRP